LSTAETPGRIRWEPVTSTSIAVETGHVGLLPSHSFVIYSPEAGRTGLTVTSQLPGQQHHRCTGDRIGELKAVAEHWLEDHVAALGASFPVTAEDPSIGARFALTEVTVRVARTHDRTADIIATIPSGIEYLSPVHVVTGSCRRTSAEEEPEKWTAYLWPCAGGSMRVTQSCDAIDRGSLDALGKALVRRLAKEGPWWT
jgi:hypothetical protein